MPGMQRDASWPATAVIHCMTSAGLGPSRGAQQAGNGAAETPADLEGSLPLKQGVQSASPRRHCLVSIWLPLRCLCKPVE